MNKSFVTDGIPNNFLHKLLTMNYWHYEDGLPYKFGANWDETHAGFNFALFSKTATQVSLLFFKKDIPDQIVLHFPFDPIKNKTGAIWHCFIKLTVLQNADSYAYRINGPSDPGNTFDPSKLLLDPWSKAVYFPPIFSRNAAVQVGDNTGRAGLSLLVKEDTNPPHFEKDKPPVHFHDLVIYEMHVRGFTKHESSGLSNELLGTYSGIVEKIPYLQELGITAVELMPVHQFDPQENNYWGYMTLNFFSPHQSYSSEADAWAIVKEFKAMVLALHQAGIEVILDVIYNHTVEGDGNGPTYSYKGIDNSAYYLLTPDMNHYLNDAGTGNIMRSAYKIVRKLILDSLRYWASEMHVDGFRFDLASIFTRDDFGNVNLVNPPLLEEISMDPVLSKVRLIAEPWDINAYQLGERFPGASWAQWNGEYRDDIRKFIKGDENMVAKVMSRVYGSADLFPELHPYNGKPYQSINFINSHDGFSLYDLLAYNNKHNEANGYDNTDGSNDNYSWNCGSEGDTGVSNDTIQLRKKQSKNLISILMFSNGIPMFRMGDEFLQTQQGNNNPFNQDNELSWLNWERKDQFADVFRFFKMVIAIRKAHASIGRGNYWRDDVEWFGVTGGTDISYFSRTLAYYINGSSMGDQDFYIMINAYWEPLTFTIEKETAGSWKRIIDTGLDSPNDIIETAAATVINANSYQVQPRSVVVLMN